jgi:hypothetical protein
MISTPAAFARVFQRRDALDLLTVGDVAVKQQRLVAKAFNLLFREYGKPDIAES